MTLPVPLLVSPWGEHALSLLSPNNLPGKTHPAPLTNILTAWGSTRSIKILECPVRFRMFYYARLPKFKNDPGHDEDEKLLRKAFLVFNLKKYVPCP